MPLDQIDFGFPVPPQPKRMIIGLCGRARSGKTTVGNMLEHEHGFVHMSFAHHLRQFITQMCVAADPFFQLERDKNKPQPWAGGKTPRQMMQTLGTEWGRTLVDPDMWVAHTMARAANFKDRNIVISDVRFDNEARAIYAAGGIIVEIIRDSAEHGHTHASERGVSRGLIDASIINNGATSTLRHTVRGVVKMFSENGLHSPPARTPLQGEQQC